MANSQLQVLGFAGSLRQASYNRALLRTAKELAPLELNIQIFDLLPIPIFNEDVEAKGDPESVQDFKKAIGEADGLLIATPEYNYGIPGVLKNAIDWVSRPPRNRQFMESRLQSWEQAKVQVELSDLS
jgi:chromate reductase